MLTDSRNIMLLSLSPVSAEWKPLAVRVPYGRRRKTGIQHLPLWNDPESYAENGSKVAKGFTDCTQRRLLAPFFEVTKPIVDCEAEPVRGDRCLPPANYTDVTLRNVASWIGQLRQKAGDPVLLQIHEHLRDSLELLPSRPILFLGEVSGWKAADRILLSTK